MIVVVGFMGAGKTTVGRLLAAKLGVPFTDSDHVIEARAGRPIPRIFADGGEPAFRELEHEVIAELLTGEDMVLALGGGAAAHEGTRAVLAAATVPVVYLRVSYAEAMRRVGGDQGRPMLARGDVARLHEDRDPLYARAATLTVDADGRSPEEIALDILARLPVLAAPALSQKALTPRSAEPFRLPGRLEHRHPQVAVRVDLVAAAGRDRESGCARTGRASGRRPSPSAPPSRRAPRPAPAAGSTPRPSRWPATLRIA